MQSNRKHFDGCQPGFTWDKGNFRHVNHGSTVAAPSDHVCQFWRCQFRIGVTTESSARSFYCCLHPRTCRESSEISPMSWNSKQIGRVVRSTLSAEAYAMSSSLDKLTWLRCIWGYILSPTFKWQYPESALQHGPKALLVTDCKSLYDLVTKLAVPNCEEWRTTIEVMLRNQTTSRGPFTV